MNDAVALCYHAVSREWPAELSVTPERLERQLTALLRRGYRGVTFQELAADGGVGRRLAVTFDDAFRSVFELAFPILTRLGIPGSVFVPTAFAGAERPMGWPGIDHWLGGPFESELAPMSWEQLDRLADAGWEVGSHTRSHPRLTELEGGRLAEELRGSRDDCERALGRPCTTIAYPYGDTDARVVEAAREAGYAAAAALPPRYHRPSPLRWPRVGVYHDDAMWRFRLKASRATRAVRAARRGRDGS